MPWAMVSNPYSHKVAIRADASLKAPVVAALATGAQVAGIGRTADNVWLLLQLPTGRQAWVLTRVVVVDQRYFTTLPIVTPGSP